VLLTKKLTFLVLISILALTGAASGLSKYSDKILTLMADGALNTILPRRVR
jgi:hypothetical protein